MTLPPGQLALLEHLCETTQDAVVMMDGESRITYFNSAAVGMFGWTPEEVIGQHVRVLMPEAHAVRHDDYVRRYLETGEPRAIGRIREVEARRKSGEEFPIELSVTELGTTENVRYGAFIRDVTDKRELQNRLVDRERLAAIGATAATLAHEVGNPLNNMGLNLKLLERSGELGSDARETLAAVQSEVARLKALLEEFRALARRERLHPETLDLVPFLQRLLQTQAATFEAHRVTLASQLPASAEIQADPAKLQQLVLNVVQNAVDAMPDGGALTVSVSPRNEEVRIQIEDTGIGIPAELDIFEPFQTTKQQGTGLGLAVARRIALAHGGAIFHAPNVPQGTVFTLLLPRYGGEPLLEG